MKNTRPVKITAEELDRRFDAGEDISEYMDLENITRLNHESQLVNGQANSQAQGELESSSSSLPAR